MRGEGNLQDHGQGSEEGVDDGAETGREGGREETSIDPRSEWVSGRERATVRRWSLPSGSEIHCAKLPHSG